jgi:uncharacterized phage protein (TIGR01671 family)
MRELKVRSWDTEAKCYVKDPILFDNFGQVYVVCDETSDKRGTCLITHKPNVIKEQYTGRKDKNGKEIYEGDIVVNTYYDDGEMYKVLWVDDSVAFGMESLDDMELYKLPLESLEVIGNIHENADLLEEKK